MCSRCKGMAAPWRESRGWRGSHAARRVSPPNSSPRRLPPRYHHCRFFDFSTLPQGFWELPRAYLAEHHWWLYIVSRQNGGRAGQHWSPDPQPGTQTAQFSGLQRQNAAQEPAALRLLAAAEAGQDGAHRVAAPDTQARRRGSRPAAAPHGAPRLPARRGEAPPVGQSPRQIALPQPPFALLPAPTHLVWAVRGLVGRLAALASRRRQPPARRAGAAEQPPLPSPRDPRSCHQPTTPPCLLPPPPASCSCCNKCWATARRGSWGRWRPPAATLSRAASPTA